MVGIYELEIVTIHKGEVPDSFSIQADAKNDIDDAEEFLLFLSPPESESGRYMLASPQGSVIPLSDARKDTAKRLNICIQKKRAAFWIR